MDEQPHVFRFFNLVAELDDREKGLTRDATPIQADTTEGMRFNDGNAGTKLGSPDRCDITARSRAEDGNVLLSWHRKVGIQTDVERRKWPMP